MRDWLRLRVQGQDRNYLGTKTRQTRYSIVTTIFENERQWLEGTKVNDPRPYKMRSQAVLVLLIEIQEAADFATKLTMSPRRSTHSLVRHVSSSVMYRNQTQKKKEPGVLVLPKKMNLCRFKEALLYAPLSISCATSLDNAALASQAV